MIYSDDEITPEELTFDGLNIPVYTFDTVIVGSGAAGLGAASALLFMGYDNTAVITESMKAGASKNPSENNQVYYKLASADSVRTMAKDLFGGFSMDGDIALTQAAYSSRCFYRLAGLGVDFPQNIYGEFSEYGEHARMADAGLLTAKKIAEAAETDILSKNIPVFNRFRTVAIIKDPEDNAAGILAIDKDMQKTYAEQIREYNLITRINNANRDIFGKIAKYKAVAANAPEPEPPQGNEFGYALFRSANIIYAAGAPAGVYADGAHFYQQSATCSFGAALLAGVRGKNLTETVFKDSKAYRFNGGLECDIYSESNIKHFFPVGEAAAVFGVNAPEGAALAAAQITALRAAEKIATDYRDFKAERTSLQDFAVLAAGETKRYTDAARLLLKGAVKNAVSENVPEMREKYRQRFSECCMAERALDDITLAAADCRYDIANFINDNKIDDITYLSDVFENYDILVTQYAFLQAARNYILSGGQSRGTYTIVRKEQEQELEPRDFDGLVSFLKIKNANTFEIEFSTREVNPIPESSNG